MVNPTKSWGQMTVATFCWIVTQFLRDNYPAIFQRCQGKRRFMVLKME